MRIVLTALGAFMVATGAMAAQTKGAVSSTPAAREKAFFAKTALQPGVATLPGLAWKVLKAGPTDGVHPGRNDTVTVHYLGRLADGTQFDASGGDGSGEASFKVSGVIAGFAAALKLMRPGDQWRVYIPAYLAYGDQEKPKIPPGSTLVFDIELVAISAAMPTP